jgi:peptidoglycan/xylan/chitin deacetylase (PgdA/CDA1 family)
MPPFEWYNQTIADWTEALGFRLVNYSPGTRSHADYTTPDLPNYVSSDSISASILEYEEADPAGLNGFILLSHVGTAPARTDKFYVQLESIISTLKDRGYTFVHIDRLLAE